MLLMIDNYDSFTYNLVHYCEELGANVTVYCNDKITLAEIDALNPQCIIISPGPGRPAQAGITLALIQHFSGKLPILGVCLGHQAIAEAFGGRIVLAERVMHGKTSSVYHNNKGVFQNLSKPLIATRYHSLVIEKEMLPTELDVTAWTQDEKGRVVEIMGIKHSSYLLEGVQFHPESILTQQGHQLLQNFLRMAALL